MAMLSDKLCKLKITKTKNKLTMAAGLGTLIELFDQSPLKNEFMACLPERTSHRSVGSYQMALTIMAAFLYGYDCLEDLDQFRNDPKLSELFGNQTAAARTHGDFLRDFEAEHLLKLNKFLNRMSRYIFNQMQIELPDTFKPRHLVIDVDSTSHENHGEKMEGLAFNYKNEWRLYGQLALVAHNILRWVAIMTRPDKPHFSKKLRKHFIFIPGKIVHHARQTFLKLMEFHYKEVQRLRERLGLNSERIPQQLSSA